MGVAKGKVERKRECESMERERRGGEREGGRERAATTHKSSKTQSFREEKTFFARAASRFAKTGLSQQIQIPLQHKKKENKI